MPITFLLVCNLGKLMLLHPAVKQMKYSFSLWYCSFYGRGFAFVPETVPRFHVILEDVLGWMIPASVVLGVQRSHGGRTGSELFQKLCCGCLQCFF